jgi:two-component system cell cycle response regulator
MVTQELSELFEITPQEIQTRRAFLLFTREDEENLIEIHRLIDSDVDIIINDFYAHLRKFEELDPFLLDAATLERLKQTQRQYVLTLGRNGDHPRYFEDRLRIGVAYERIGLPQKWYLGAHAVLFELIGWKLARRHTGGQMKFFSFMKTLQKVLTLDAILAVETYYRATTERLEHILHRSAEDHHHLQVVSQLDSLTQIKNRQFLLEALETELHRSRRFQHPFTLLFVDIDHFKHINDHYGHAFGDTVLQTLVRLMSEVVRPTDILGRYGGEEFLIGLLEADETIAHMIAERLRLKVATTPFPFNQHCISITISIGVASLIPEIDKIETLIERADRALYQAKQTGRNQVCVSQGDA